MKNPDEIVELIYNKYSQRHSIAHLTFEAEKMQKIILPNTIEIGYSNPRRWEKIIEIYKETGMLQQEITTEGLFYTDYLKKKTKIPWKYIIPLIAILLIFSSITLLLYSISKKLKAEIKQGKQLHKQYVESELRYHTIYEKSRDPISIIKDNKFIDCNQATLDILKIESKDDFKNLLPSEISPKYQPDNKLSAEKQYTMIDTAMKKGSHTFEWLHKNSLNETIWFDISLTKIALKDEVFLFVIWKDITKRKEISITLQKSKARLDAIINTTLTGITILDYQGKHLFTNEKSKNIHGYTKSELIAQHINIIIHPDDVKFSKKIIENLISKKVDFVNIEIRLLHKKTKEPIWIHLNATRYPKINSKDKDSILIIFQNINHFKKAEQALAKSEEKYRILADYAYDWEYWIDTKKDFIYVSPSVERISGYKASEFYADNNLMLKIIHPDYKELLLNHRHEKDEIEETKRIEFKIITKNKEVHWIGHICHKVYGEDGKYMGIRGNNRLITKQKKAEQALKESEKRYRTYFEQGGLGMAKTSPEKGWIEVNDIICNMFGYTHEEFNTLTWDKMTHPDDLKLDLSQFGQVQAGEIDSYSMNKRFFRKNGEIFYSFLTVNAIRKPDGSIDYMIAILKDITELLEIEQALKDSEMRWQFAVDGSELGLWDWDIPNNKIFFSKQWKNMLGYDDDEIGNTSEEWSERIHPDDKKSVSEDMQKHTDGIVPIYTNEHRLLCKDGTYKWILSKGISITTTEDGKPKRMLGTHADIHEQKLVKEELMNLNATKDKFFSIIAHDLKSPFTAMLGFSTILNENFDKYDTAKQKEFLSYIHIGIERAYNLLENLLLWSRSQEGNIELRPEEINLYLLANEAIELLNQSADNKSLKLLNKIHIDTFVVADKYMLSTIIRNLISNAIKFTAQDGKIIIKADLTANDKQFVKITVKDNGVGISKEIQSKLFDISENVSTHGTENEAGTGLGLILCKEFVEKHNGKIWIESEIDKGSSFHFTIPYKSEI